MTVETDYRVENAKVGRAFYLPGKTVGEVAAERTEREAAANRPVQVTLTEAQAKAAEVEIAAVPHLLWDVANALDLLEGGIMTRCIDPEDPGIQAILGALKEQLRRKADALDPLFENVAKAMLARDKGNAP